MSSASKKPSARRLQYGALPYRKSNRAEFMLVTSRETRRWIIPKGWPKKGKSPHRSAAREAFEEAGVLGAVGRQPVGSFSYKKRLPISAQQPSRKRWQRQAKQQDDPGQYAINQVYVGCNAQSALLNLKPCGSVYRKLTASLRRPNHHVNNSLDPIPY